MDINFLDIVNVTRSSCDKCLMFVYQVPCEIDKSIVSFMESFGEPMYDIDEVNLLKIESDDNYIIEGRLKRTNIKFRIPKKLENTINIDSNYRKAEFEICLGKWLSSKYNIPIWMNEKYNE